MKCNFCSQTFKIQNELIKHLYNECIQPELLCNIYNFNPNLLGNKIYENENGGDIYIIQKDNLFSSYYKIGMTKDLDKRYSQYKCGNLLDPIIYYYYPFRNIGNIDRLLKKKLKKYKFKKEIYKCDNLNEIRDIIKYLQFHYDNNMIELTPGINPDLKLIKNTTSNEIISINVPKESTDLNNQVNYTEKTNSKIESNNQEDKEKIEIINTIQIDPIINLKNNMKPNIPNDNISNNIKKKCDICNKEYSSYKNLWRHNNTFHKNNDNNFKCKYCPNIYNHKQSRTRHEKTCKNITHTIPIFQTFSCTICKKDYTHLDI